MKILWIEDFNRLPRVKVIIGLFSGLIPKEILINEYDPDSPDIQAQLSNLFKKYTPHQMYVCESYSEWKRIYEQHGGHFDIALIDINLDTYQTPADDIPEGIHNRSFDRKAGLYIYHQLIKHGFLNENITFFTGEGQTLEEFTKSCRDIFLEGPQHCFEKNPAHFEMVRAWIKSKAIEFQAKAKRIFISYAKEDIDKAYSVFLALKREGYSLWIDKENLLVGQNWDLEIQMAIQECDLFVACLSKNSVTKDGYVQEELKKGLKLLDRKPEGLIYLIPVRLDECKVPSRFQTLQWCDMFESNWKERLLNAVKVACDTNR
jgi:hypothetical protein